jgi:uridylate kinase
MSDIAQVIMSIHMMGVSATVIVGGGNIFRGTQAGAWHLDRQHADRIGMAATGVNALLLHGSLMSMGVPAQIFSRGPCTGIGSPYNLERLRAVLVEGGIPILAGGMGISGFSTDVPAVYAAIDTHAEVIIMAKHGTDGVYDADPVEHPDARLIPELTASDALASKLGVMDSAALTLALDFGKLIHVVAAKDPNCVRLAVEGKEIGSIIQPW